CEYVAQLLDQFFAEQSLSRRFLVEGGFIHAIDKIEGGYVGIAAHHEVPALITDINPECGPLVAEGSITQIGNTRGDQWAAIRKYLVSRQTPGDVIGVVH